MDFGWMGVVGLNLLWGVVGGIVAGRPLGGGGLPAVAYYSAVPYYSAVATLFFKDHLLWFPNLV
jgi:hypothetical protein